MTQPAEKIDMHDFESELDKIITDIKTGSETPVIKPAADPYPFKGNSTAEALRAASRAEGERIPPFRPRPLSDADRTPIPPANPAPQRDAATPPPPAQDVVAADIDTTTAVEAFMASGQRLLDMQRTKIIKLESEYEFDRVKLIDDYRVKMRELEHEAGEALRSFDRQHESEMAGAKRILDSLLAMRG